MATTGCTDDHFHDECGVFGIYGHPDAAALTALGLHARLPGAMAIGHVRYATTGEVAARNIQPLFADFEFGGLAICHNGNLTNSYQLRRQLVRRGSLFQSTSDTEVIVHLIATSLKETVVE